MLVIQCGNNGEQTIIYHEIATDLFLGRGSVLTFMNSKLETVYSVIQLSTITLFILNTFTLCSFSARSESPER